jgi:hypothetical protein
MGDLQTLRKTGFMGQAIESFRMVFCYEILELLMIRPAVGAKPRRLWPVTLLRATILS